MKTLTLLEAYKTCVRKVFFTLDQMLYYRGRGGKTLYSLWQKRHKKRYKQFLKFEYALTKRLQEQDEELAYLRALKRDTVDYCAIPGFDYPGWRKKYFKEKTNE